ncbi:hypothetical protein [Streptomyces sp. NPDC001286]
MSDDEQALVIAREALEVSRSSNRFQKRSSRAAVTASVIAALALGLGFWNRQSQDAAATRLEKQAQEDRRAAQEASRRVEAEHVDVEKGVKGDMVTIRNWNPTSLGFAVVRIVLPGGGERYARISTVKPCTEWQVTDKRLKEKGLRPNVGSRGFIEGSVKVQVWFTDWRGRTWTKEPNKELFPGAYRKTRANKQGAESSQFRRNSVEVAEKSFIPIDGCGSGQP